MTVIVDYGVGNLFSIKNMLARCGAEAEISSELSVIESASRYILPGVGSFDHGISQLKLLQSFQIFEDRVLARKVPVLGICLGAQLMTSASEEGTLRGLSWIPGRVERFREERLKPDGLKIPHMAWADVEAIKSSRLFADMYTDPRFYFVHSYHFVCDSEPDQLLRANYGYDFVAGFEKENILGVQFHPEKSHKYGMKLFENFIKYY